MSDRLRVHLAGQLDTADANHVLGSVDVMTLHLLDALLHTAAFDEPASREVLGYYFGGAEDEGTTSRF